MISFLFLRGRCRYCGEKISIRYPIVEALTAALFLASYVKSGFSVQFAVYVIFSALLITISFIDIEHFMIPDFLMLIGIAVGLAYSIYSGTFAGNLAAMCFAFLFMLILGEGAGYVLKKEALGDGDIKLLVMFASFMGLERTFLSLAFGSVLGAAVGLLAVWLKRLKMDDRIPFAPFLALGAVVSILIW